MKDETILYDPRTVRFCVLNATASFLWARLATPQSMGGLLADVNSEFRVDDPKAAERALEGTLAELVQLSFVESGAIDGAAAHPADAGTNGHEDRATFAAPTLRMMDESEVLTQFQVSSAGMTWWAT